MEKTLQFTKEDAENFFGELFYGKHHIPSDVKPFGYGWYVFTHTGLSFATTDYNNLTRMVLMAHRDAIRVEIRTHSPGRLKICIWKRKRDGGLTESHPTIEQAIDSFNNYKRL